MIGTTVGVVINYYIQIKTNQTDHLISTTYSNKIINYVLIYIAGLKFFCQKMQNDLSIHL